MGKMGKVLVSFAVVGVLGCSSFVYAQSVGNLTDDEVSMIKQQRQNRASMQAKIQEELGLTDEQVQQLDDYRNQQREQMKQDRQTMKQLKEEIKQETEKTEIDEAKIKSIHEQLKTLNNKMSDNRLDGILQLRKILTPEQFKKFNEARGKRGKMRQGNGRKIGQQRSF